MVALGLTMPLLFQRFGKLSHDSNLADSKFEMGPKPRRIGGEMPPTGLVRISPLSNSGKGVGLTTWG